MSERSPLELQQITAEDCFQNLAGSLDYGCIFCKTGLEQSVARSLNQRYDGIKALAVTQLKHKSCNGIKTVCEQILLPGYVLFRAYEENPPLYEFTNAKGVIRVIRNTSGDWRLGFRDRSFADWVFEKGGLIGMSTAYYAGDKVHVHTGALKDYEGSLLKIDRRSRNGLVEIHFGNKTWRIWLAFEMIELCQVS